MSVTSPGSSLAQYLTFVLAEEEYAVDILQVREIFEYEIVTRVPFTPPWIRGVINLRGGVVPVVDLAVKFGLPACTVSRHTCIIIVEIDLDGQPTPMGVMADSVKQVIDLKPEDIEPPPAFGTRVRVDFLLGMAGVAKKFLLLLDLSRVLSADEILVATTIAEVDPEEVAAPAGVTEDTTAELTQVQTSAGVVPLDAVEIVGTSGLDMGMQPAPDPVADSPVHLAPTPPEIGSATADES
jgi:purine-binding chemotaxis protein CheW